MSYEGMEYFLCEKGHLIAIDAALFLYPVGGEDFKNICVHCGTRFIWQQSVDETNGFREGDVWTYFRKLELDHYEDVPHADHYGNKYFTRLECWKIPTDQPGRMLKDDEK